MSVIYKFILEKKIKLSIIFSFILILILIGFQLQKFWKEFNDLKIINNQQSQRIKDLNNDYEFTVNKIKNDYNLNFLSKCSNLDYLTDKDLSLKIDKTNKKIYYDKIFKILNFNTLQKLLILILIQFHLRMT